MDSYSETKLDNGLTLVTGENRSSPIITLQLVVRAGSSFEKPGELGYAHILEHMLLKGTKRRPSSFSVGLEIDRIGASSNAHTQSEAAWFIMQAASEHSEILFDILSDNILHSLIDPDVLEGEKKIIISEFHERENILTRASTVEALKQYTSAHPVAHDPLGSSNDIKIASTKKLRTYYSRYYTPNNCALIVTGNITSGKAHDLARRYFGEWTRSENNFPVHPPIQFLHGHSGFIEYPGEIDYMTVHYGTQATVDSKDQAALELILSYLSYGYTSALRSELRSKRGLAYSPSASARYYKQASFVTISVATKNPDDVLPVIDEIISTLPEKVDSAWVDAMRTQTIGIFERRLSDSFYEARYLREQFINHNKLVTPEDGITVLKRIGVEDVRTTIKKCLNPTSRFVFVLGKVRPAFVSQPRI